MDPSAKTSVESVEDDRTGLSVPVLRRACADNLFYVQGKFPAIATKNDLYMALAYTVRDRLLHRWINTAETYLKEKQHELKLVCYLSAEFLLGPRLGNSLINLGIYDQVRQAMEESGHSQLLKETTLHDFFELWPHKFLNVTNGVTPRRFLAASNPRLSSLVTQKIGDSWIKQLHQGSVFAQLQS
jgi:glucan phosphorylase